MKTTTRRFLKVLIDKPDKVKATLQVLESSKNILSDAGLLLKQEEANLGELDIYYRGLEDNLKIKPFPKLSIGQSFFVGLVIDDAKLSFKNNIKPQKGQVALLEIDGNEAAPENGEKVFELKNAETLTVRKNLSLFRYDKPNFGTTQKIKILDSTEQVIIETLVNIQQENGIKRLNYSFDFSNYPTGVYRIVMEGNVVFSERFIVDKNSELSGFTALIKAKYDDNNLKYNTLKPFLDDHFINFKIITLP
jgi:hypothetical protein